MKVPFLVCCVIMSCVATFKLFYHNHYFTELYAWRTKLPCQNGLGWLSIPPWKFHLYLRPCRGDTESILTKVVLCIWLINGSWCLDPSLQPQLEHINASPEGSGDAFYSWYPPNFEAQCSFSYLNINRLHRNEKLCTQTQMCL